MLGNLNKLIIILLSSIILIGCSPFINKDLRRKNKCNRKLDRVVRKCPELLKTDTIEKVIVVEIPAIEIRDSIQIVPDTLGVDSIFNSYKTSFLDSIGQLKLRNTVIKYIQSNPCTSDTLIKKVGRFTVKAWFSNGHMQIDVGAPKRKIRKNIPIEVPVVKNIELTIWEQLMNALSKIWWWIIGVVVLFILYKLFRKSLSSFF